MEFCRDANARKFRRWNVTGNLITSNGEIQTMHVKTAPDGG
ncbi:hypothetical protein J2T12_000961 [Paenibacillus anaericanus]|nr:hypothetical protein [Paenibacillus anaericanus]MDQ0087567.1 hypothetical protein [Paenibacillus anaericanus]